MLRNKGESNKRIAEASKERKAKKEHRAQLKGKRDAYASP
jgi:hypothetical protein